MTQNISNKLVGLVKWFRNEEGYGVVSNPEEGDFFLHKNNFIDKPKNIPDGMSLIFEKSFDQKKNRNIALHCRRVGEPGDWEIILNYLGKTDTVEIKTEVLIKGGNQYRSAYYRNMDYPFSLIELSAQQYLKGKNESEILSVVKDYFDNKLEKKNFILYCEFLEKRLKKAFKEEIALTLLSEIHSYFRKNANKETCFYVWKDISTNHIAYHNSDLYKIDQNVLRTFISEIGLPELKRILRYEFGSEFCADFLKSRIEEIQTYDTKKILDIYPFLELIDEESRGEYIIRLDKELVVKNTCEIFELAKDFGVIKSKLEFQNYDRLRALSNG